MNEKWLFPDELIINNENKNFEEKKESIKQGEKNEEKLIKKEEIKGIKKEVKNFEDKKGEIKEVKKELTKDIKKEVQN